jgi:hypothetical protein
MNNIEHCAQIEAKLKALPILECTTCAFDIDVLYNLNKELIWRNEDLLSMAISQSSGQKIFVSGRVVIVRNGVSLLSVTGLHLNQWFSILREILL